MVEKSGTPRIDKWMVRAIVWTLRALVWMLRAIVWMVRALVWMLKTEDAISDCTKKPRGVSDVLTKERTPRCNDWSSQGIFCGYTDDWVGVRNILWGKYLDSHFALLPNAHGQQALVPLRAPHPPTYISTVDDLSPASGHGRDCSAREGMSVHRGFGTAGSRCQRVQVSKGPAAKRLFWGQPLGGNVTVRHSETQTLIQ
eukprot:205328-Prorocentrum_minimum.AAC.1